MDAERCNLIETQFPPPETIELHPNGQQPILPQLCKTWTTSHPLTSFPCNIPWILTFCSQVYKYTACVSINPRNSFLINLLHDQNTHHSACSHVCDHQFQLLLHYFLNFCGHFNISYMFNLFLIVQPYPIALLSGINARHFTFRASYLRMFVSRNIALMTQTIYPLYHQSECFLWSTDINFVPPLKSHCPEAKTIWGQTN